MTHTALLERTQKCYTSSMCCKSAVQKCCTSNTKSAAKLKTFGMLSFAEHPFLQGTLLTVATSLELVLLLLTLLGWELTPASYLEVQQTPIPLTDHPNIEDWTALCRQILWSCHYPIAMVQQILAINTWPVNPEQMLWSLNRYAPLNLKLKAMLAFYLMTFHYRCLLKSKCSDCIIYQIIHNSTDKQEVQLNLTWLMTLNPSKYKTMTSSRHQNPSFIPYCITNTFLESVESFKYLGITSASTYHEHNHC